MRYITGPPAVPAEPLPPYDPPMHRTRVAIVGAGPIGIELAIALKRRDIPYVHLESRQIGAKLS